MLTALRVFCIISEIVLLGTSIGRFRFLDPLQSLSALALYGYLVGAMAGNTRGVYLHRPASIALVIDVAASVVVWIYVYFVYRPGAGIQLNGEAETDRRQRGARRLRDKPSNTGRS